MQDHIVLICGAKRAGKDTRARHYIERGYTHLKFAGIMKECIKLMFGFTDEHLETDLKETVVDSIGMTPRDVMTKFGTDAVFPTFGDNLWAEAVCRQIEALCGPRRVVISDLRFFHELDTVKSHFPFALTEVVKVVRPGMAIPKPTHRSEMEWEHLPIDSVFINE